MGCCGRKSRVEARPIQKGQAVKEVQVRPVAPQPPAARVPQPVAPSAPPAAVSIVQPDKTVVCKRCGARLVLKRMWSERLRRYYNVSWCSGCRKEA